MRIDRSDPDVTLIENRPVFLPVVCLLFVAAGVYTLYGCIRTGGWSQNDVTGIIISLLFGGGGFLYTARRDSYRFDGRTERLTWTRRSLLAKHDGWLPLTDIEQVVVESGPETDSTTYRVVLRTASHGVLPLTNDYSACEAHYREVARVIEEIVASEARAA